jgi:hypothetical protein
MRARTTALAAAIGLAGVAGAQPERVPSAPAADSVGIYSGVYASTFNESIFSACDVPGIGSGWWLRFHNERDGRFLRYQYSAAGMPTVSHFIRVRGRLSPPGNYGEGFQTRELVVDSVLDVQETMQECASYEELPQPWPAIKSSGAPIIGATTTNDGVQFALLDREGFVSVWNTRIGALVNRFPSGDEGALASAYRVPLAFTRDGKRLAEGGLDGVVRVWNPVTGERIWTLPATDTMSGTVNGRKVVAASAAIDFNQSGSLLANNVNERIAIWSMDTGKRVDTFKEGWWYSKFLFIDDASFIASGDSGLVKIYPRFGAEPIWRFKTPLRTFRFMERSSDGRWLFLNGSSDSAFLWSLSDGQLAHKIAIPSWFGFGAVAFSPDGKILATSGGRNGIYLWDTKTGKPLRSFQKFPNIVIKTWFTADGKSIVGLAMYDTVLRVVHLDPGKGPFGAPNAVPVQAWWGAHSWPARVPGRGLGSITGFVTDSAKKPIIGVDIAAFDGDKPGSAPLASATTNAAGRYLLQGVNVQHVTLRAMMRGFAPDVRHTHLATQGVEANFELKKDR